MTVKTVRHDVAGPPRGVVLMLHGGGEEPEAHLVDDRHLGYARLLYLHWCIKKELASHGLSLWLVRNRFNSWNAPTDEGVLAPVADAQAGLAALRAVHGADVPVVVVGHSMGARAALHVVDSQQVVGMVALAPWLPPEEPVEPLRDRHLAAAVSGADTEVDPLDVRAFVARADPVARSSIYKQIGNRGPGVLAHGMGHNVGDWHRFIIHNALRMTAGTGTCQDGDRTPGV